MANFITVRVGGVWAGNSPLLSTEMAEIDSRWPKLINAADGSAHAPTTPIILGGQGLRMTGPTDIDGDVDQDAGSTWSMNGETRFLDNALLDMRVDSTQVFRLGSLLQINEGAEVQVAGDLAFGSTGTISGTAKVAPGASLSVDNTASLQMLGGSSFVMALGSTGTINGNVTWGNGLYPRVTSRAVSRCEWRIAAVTYSGTAPDSPRAWLETTLDGPAIKTDDATSAHYFFVELLDLPDGGTLDSVTIRTLGVAGNSSLTLPEYTLYRWGAGTTPAALGDVEDAHNPALWTSAVNTTLTPDSTVTIDRQYHYGVQVRAPYHASVAASMYILDFKSSSTIQDIRR